jgi:hypothetical protein
MKKEEQSLKRPMRGIKIPAVSYLFFYVSATPFPAGEFPSAPHCDAIPPPKKRSQEKRRMK